MGVLASIVLVAGYRHMWGVRLLWAVVLDREFLVLDLRLLACFAGANVDVVLQVPRG